MYSRWAPFTFETLWINTIFEGLNARSAGDSVVETIAAERPVVSDHHINISPFHVFLASHESRLWMPKPGRS